jgi:HD-GYP domain-containing protein (c-di-GMP phosphodiesterase class II)
MSAERQAILDAEMQEDPGVVRDPTPVLRSLAALRRACALYPSEHPGIEQHVTELQQLIDPFFESRDTLQIDVIRGVAMLDGRSFRKESLANAHLLGELAELEVDSVHLQRSVTADELRAAGHVLAEWHGEGSLREALHEAGVRNIDFGRIVAIDSSWRFRDWPEAPDQIPDQALDPDYAELLSRAEETFATVEEGRDIDVGSVRELLQVLVHKVSTNSVALGQVMAMKQYENFTYCHSVNVSLLSLLLGDRLGLDETTRTDLAEAALLHDVGKMRLPVEILRKPGPLDQKEWQLIQRHPRLGAQILVGLDGLAPMTTTIALEHHMNFDGEGYPDLGPDVEPHFLSQLVAVVDTYESLTGARSYRDPAEPEKACLILARMAGEKLNPALVKAFVSAVTFFPVSSIVRTNRQEIGVVVEAFPEHPLHPRLALVDSHSGQPTGVIVDTRKCGENGEYERHVTGSLGRNQLRVNLAAVLQAYSTD